MTPEEQDAFLRLVDSLTPGDRSAVVSFAQFLASRSGATPSLPAGEASPPAAVEIPAPADIARPDEERVVAAVKRLSKTYFMLDKKLMLGATSDLVTQHVLHGRDAAEVIDELEGLFKEQYRQLGQDKSS